MNSRESIQNISNNQPKSNRFELPNITKQRWFQSAVIAVAAVAASFNVNIAQVRAEAVENLTQNLSEKVVQIDTPNKVEQNSSTPVVESAQNTDNSLVQQLREYRDTPKTSIEKTEPVIAVPQVVSQPIINNSPVLDAKQAEVVVKSTSVIQAEQQNQKAIIVENKSQENPANYRINATPEEINDLNSVFSEPSPAHKKVQVTTKTSEIKPDVTSNQQVKTEPVKVVENHDLSQHLIVAKKLSAVKLQNLKETKPQTQLIASQVAPVTNVKQAEVKPVSEVSTQPSVSTQSQDLLTPEIKSQDLNQFLTKQPKNETKVQSNTTNLAPSTTDYSVSEEDLESFFDAFGDEPDFAVVDNFVESTNIVTSKATTQVEIVQSQEAHNLFGQAVTQGLPSFATPANLPVGNFNSNTPKTITGSLNTDSVNGPSVNYSQTNITKTVAGSDQAKRQIVTYVEGNTLQVKPEINGTVTTGNVITTQKGAALGFQEFIPGIDAQKFVPDSKNYNITTQVQAVQITPSADGKIAPKVTINGEEFSASTFPDTPLNAFNATPDNGTIFQLFPGNVPAGVQIKPGQELKEKLGTGPVLTQPGMQDGSLLPKTQQELANKAFYWDLGGSATSNLQPLNTVKINVEKLGFERFQSGNVINFRPDGGLDAVSSTRKQDYTIVANLNPTSFGLEIERTLKNQMAGLAGYIPINSNVKKAVTEQEIKDSAGEQIIDNPNQLTVNFKEDTATKKSGESFAGLNKAAANLRTVGIYNPSFSDSKFSVDGSSYSALSIQAGGIASNYNITQASTTGDTVKGPVVIKSVTTPAVTPLSKLYTYIQQTNNLTGKTEYQKRTSLVGNTGGFINVTTDQKNTTPYEQINAIGIDVNPGVSAAYTIGNKNTTFVAAGTVSFNPFSDYITNDIKYKTPVIIGTLNANLNQKLSNNLNINLAAKLTNDLRSDNPITGSAVLTYNPSSSLSISAGGIYINGGSNSTAGVLPYFNLSSQISKFNLNAGLVGSYWNASINRNINSNLNIGLYIQNSPKINGTTQTQTQQTGEALTYGLTGTINLNKHFSLNGLVGKSGDMTEYQGSVTYKVGL